MQKKIALLVVTVFLLVLTACNKDDASKDNQGSVNDGESSNGYGSIDHGVDEGKIGFFMQNGAVEEVANVPSKEKEELLNIFTLYMDSFNNKDIETFIGTLSDQTKSSNKAANRLELEKNFKLYDVKRAATDIVIASYSADQAQVYSTMDTTVMELGSGEVLEESRGKQVTVFVKVDEEWKVNSIHFVPNEK